MRRHVSAGITLIELMVAVTLSTFVIFALATAFGVATRASIQTETPVRNFETAIQFEDRVRSIISRAYVSESEEDLNSYFIGRSTGGGTGGAGDGADEIVLTTAGKRPSAAALEAEESEFEARNERFGPVGGIVETGLSTVPVGDAGNNSGLFIREQQPADSDTDQGGYERVLDGRIDSVSFEFYDGTDWAVEWDTNLNRALPQAVRVSYTVADDPEAVKVFVVRLENARPPTTEIEGAPAEEDP